MTISSLATGNPGGGGLPRKKSWKQSIKEGVVTGAGIGVVCAVIVIAMGTWGDYPERMLVKREARTIFSPDHVMEAKVLHGGPRDPSWICWGPGHPVHACRPFTPDKDMPPSCIQTMSSIPAPMRKIAREIYGGTDEWGPPHPCRGIRIAEILLHEGADLPPRSIPEWVLPNPEK